MSLNFILNLSSLLLKDTKGLRPSFLSNAVNLATASVNNALADPSAMREDFFQLGLFKAQSLFAKKPAGGQAAGAIAFMSLANLITALLDEITKHYVTGASALDKQMRFRINKTVEILNDYPELSNILLKGDPFGS